MKATKIIIMILIACTLTSCMTTRTSINKYKETPGQTYKYSKGKQMYLFWGLIPIGRTSVATPVNEPCQVRTSYRFTDVLLTSITGGVFSMQTIKVIAKHNSNIIDQDYFKKGDIVTYNILWKSTKGTIDSIIDNEKCFIKTEDGKLIKVKFENLSNWLLHLPISCFARF